MPSRNACGMISEWKQDGNWVIFGQNFERITFVSLFHADYKYVISFFLLCQEDPEKFIQIFEEKIFFLKIID